MTQVKQRLRLGPDLVAATLALTMPGFLGAAWLAPRAAPPIELPPLIVDAEEARASIAADRARAAQAPQSPEAARRRRLFEEQNRVELQGEIAEAGEARRREIRRLLAILAREGGDQTIAAIRAADVERMVPALEGEGSAEARTAILGGFRRALERWGAVVGTRRVAPELVIRALYAARWNAIHSLDLTEGLDPAQLRAYHGWLALHGDAADLGMRLAALDAYGALGGPHAYEARGVLAWQAQQWEAAEAAFTLAYESQGSVRHRNHAHAAAVAASALHLPASGEAGSGEASGAGPE